MLKIKPPPPTDRKSRNRGFQAIYSEKKRKIFAFMDEDRNKQTTPSTTTTYQKIEFLDNPYADEKIEKLILDMAEKKSMR